MRIRRFLSLATVAACAAGLFGGCNTPTGKYFADRAADFGDCWRLQVGAGFGAGASVRAAGNLDLGLSVGSFPREWGLGWDYGTGYAFGLGETGLAYDSEVNLSLFVLALQAGSNRNSALNSIPIPAHWNTSAAAYSTLNPLASTHGCFGIFPGLLGWVNRRDVRVDKEYGKGNRAFMLWSGRAIRANKWEHIHAFDIEATAMAGFVRVSAGFSPGEFVDFVLGWFGLDIARDDGRWEPGAPTRAPYTRRGDLQRRPSLR